MYDDRRTPETFAARVPYTDMDVPVKVTLNLDPPKEVPCVVPLYSRGGVPPGYQPVPMYVIEGSKSSRRIAFGFVSAICPQRVRVSRW